MMKKKKACIEKQSVIEIMKGRELKEASGSLLPSFSLVGGK